MIKKLNMFFFDAEVISLKDAVFFYGIYVFSFMILAGVILPAWVQL